MCAPVCADYIPLCIWVQAVCNSLGMYNISYCVWAGVCLSSIPTVRLWAAWPHYKALSLSTWVLPDPNVFSTTSPGPPPTALAWAPQPGTLRTGPGTTMPPSFTSFKPWTGRDGAARQRPDARPAASDKQKPSSLCPALWFFSHPSHVSAIAGPYSICGLRRRKSSCQIHCYFQCFSLFWIEKEND